MIGRFVPQFIKNTLLHRVAISRNKKRFLECLSLQPWFIEIGASREPQKGWISTQIEFFNILKLAHWKNYFLENTVKGLFAEHVWEHLAPDKAQMAAAHCFRFLEPGGFLRVAVPDGFHPDPNYRENVRPGGTGPGAADHKVLYNIQTFTRLFENAGFEVKPLEYFSEKGAFVANPWEAENGFVKRSFQNDPRNKEGKPVYTSLVLDAIKPK